LDSNTFANLVIAGVYYTLTGILVFFAAFGVYVLTRYGRSLLLVLFVNALFILFFLKILSASYQTLHSLF